MPYAAGEPDLLDGLDLAFNRGKGGYRSEGRGHAGEHAREEIFDPIISTLPFTDVDEVIRRGNATTFGLGSGV